MTKDKAHHPDAPSSSPIPPLEEGPRSSLLNRIVTLLLIGIIVVLGFLYLKGYKRSSDETSADLSKKARIERLKEEADDLKGRLTERQAVIDKLTEDLERLKKFDEERDKMARQNLRLKREIDENEQIILTLQTDLQARNQTIESLQQRGEEAIGSLDSSFRKLTPLDIGQFPDIYTKAEAIASLKQHGSDAYSYLEQKAQDENERVRFTAVDAAGELGGQRGLKILKGRFADEVPLIRMLAAYWYTLRGEEKEIKPLLDTLKKGSPEDQTWALYYMGELGAPEAISIAGKMLSSEDENLRSLALYYLSKIEHPSVLPFLKEALVKAAPERKQSIVRTLAFQGDKSVVPSLLEGIQDEDMNLRLLSLQSLAYLGIPEGVSALRETLSKDESPSMRSIAARALGDRRDSVSFQPLLNATTDSSPFVRENAALALGNIGQGEAVSVLKELLNDSNGSVANAAAIALLKFKDRSGLSRLTQGLLDPVDRVRSRQALIALTGEDLGSSPEDWRDRLQETG